MEIKPFTDGYLWNRFVETQNPWSFFQSWEWGEVHRKIDNEIIRWGFYDRGNLIGIAQIILIKAKRGTFLHIRHGPVFLKNDHQHWTLFLEKIRSLGKERGCDFVRVSPMLENSLENQKFLMTLGFNSSPIHRMDGENCWILDLGKNEEEILAGMRKTTRYLIRHAERAGVEISQSIEIDRFLPLYTQTAKRHEFVPHQGIREEFALFSKAKKAYLLLAKQGDELLAASLFIRFASQLIYHHSASIPSRTGATHLLQWHAIKLAKKLGLQYYNFWGIAPITAKRHPWRGITLFKQGFGGQEKQFIHAQDMALTPFYSITWFIESVRRITRGY